MKRFILLCVIVLFNSIVYSQTLTDTIKNIVHLPIANNRATIENFPFNKILNISKDSLNKGFNIILHDRSYKIVSFFLFYDCQSCDLWIKMITGSEVNINNAPILKNIQKDELLQFMYIKIEKNGK